MITDSNPGAILPGTDAAEDIAFLPGSGPMGRAACYVAHTAVTQGQVFPSSFCFSAAQHSAVRRAGIADARSKIP